MPEQNRDRCVAPSCPRPVSVTGPSKPRTNWKFLPTVRSSPRCPTGLTTWPILKSSAPCRRSQGSVSTTGIGSAEQRTTNWSLQSSAPEATRTIWERATATPGRRRGPDGHGSDRYQNSRVLSNSPDFAVGDTSFSSASVSPSSFLVVARFFADSCAYPDDVSLEAPWNASEISAAVAEVGGHAGAIHHVVEVGYAEVAERRLGKETDADGSVVGDPEDPNELPLVAIGG